MFADQPSSGSRRRKKTCQIAKSPAGLMLCTDGREVPMRTDSEHTNCSNRMHACSSAIDQTHFSEDQARNVGCIIQRKSLRGGGNWRLHRSARQFTDGSEGE